MQNYLSKNKENNLLDFAVTNDNSYVQKEVVTEVADIEPVKVDNEEEMDKAKKKLQENISKLTIEDFKTIDKTYYNFLPEDKKIELNALLKDNLLKEIDNINFENKGNVRKEYEKLKSEEELKSEKDNGWEMIPKTELKEIVFNSESKNIDFNKLKDLFNFKIGSTKDNDKKLVVFSDPTCPNCRKMKPVLEKLAKEEGYEITEYPVPAKHTEGYTNEVSIGLIQSFACSTNPKRLGMIG